MYTYSAKHDEQPFYEEDGGQITTTSTEPVLVVADVSTRSKKLIPTHLFEKRHDYLSRMRVGIQTPYSSAFNHDNFRTVNTGNSLRPSIAAIRTIRRELVEMLKWQR
jgi:hypothetical protein